MSAAVVERRREAAWLTADAAWLDTLLAAGLDRAEGWMRRLAEGASGGAGRGATAVLRPDGRPPLRLKQMRRGGWIAPLWRERYPGRGRPLANFTVPRQAAGRGAPTPVAVGLLTLSGPPGLYRAWLALEEVEPAEDLMQLLREGRPPDASGWRALVGAVRRLHDLGVEHPDLNLGNLLLQRRPEEAPLGWVLDLDRARLHDEALGPAARERALRRLERSYLRAVGKEPEAFSRRLRTLYATGA